MATSTNLWRVIDMGERLVYATYGEGKVAKVGEYSEKAIKDSGYYFKEVDGCFEIPFPTYDYEHRGVQLRGVRDTLDKCEE